MVSIITVTYNSENYIRDCVGSTIAAFESGYLIEHIVVDNASSDNTIQTIYDLDFRHVKLIKAPKNLGFGAACNLGASSASGNILLFLNPDAACYHDSIEKSVSSLRTSQADVLGIRQVDSAGVTVRSCCRIINPTNYFFETSGLSKLLPTLFPGYRMTEWDHESSRLVEHVIGSFYMMSKDLFNRLDGFDEGYFVYYEDLDLSRRVLAASGTIFYDHTVSYFHEGGGSSEQVKSSRELYMYQSIRHYAHKFYGTGSAILMMLTFALLRPFGFTVLNASKFKFKDILTIWSSRIKILRLSQITASQLSGAEIEGAKAQIQRN